MTEQRQVDGSPRRLGLVPALRRRLPIVLACAAFVPAAALVFSLLQDKEYTATAQLLFRDPGVDETVLGSPFFSTSGDPAREAATNLRLVSLGTVADRTARRLGRGVNGRDVGDKVDIKQEGLASLVSISATDKRPRFAARLVNAFAQEFIRFRREADTLKVREALRLTRRQLKQLSPVARRSPQGRLLRQRADQLETLAALQTGNAELVQRAATPRSPSSPRTGRNVALGAVIGLLLGLLLALLLDRLDRRIQDPEELAEIFDRPILAAVPHSRGLTKGGPNLRLTDPIEGEAFRMLRANLRYFNVDRELNSVLVTSSAPGEGKSTVSCNLAGAAAANGARVLLIEADLRHPSLGKGLGLQTRRGLTNVLAGMAELREIVQEVSVLAHQTNPDARRTMDVAVAGPLPPNPTDLVESERMREILRTAEREYDLVVVDTPPTSVVSDAIPLVTQVDGVIVVGRLGQTMRDSLVHLSHQLKNLGAPTLGVVANSITARSGVYGYQYGYGQAYAADPKRVDSSLVAQPERRTPAEPSPGSDGAQPAAATAPPATVAAPAPPPAPPPPPATAPPATATATAPPATAPATSASPNGPPTQVPSAPPQPVQPQAAPPRPPAPPLPGVITLRKLRNLRRPKP